ncbi:hypothetical protein [Candidatus Odyssella acanthamoebae]|uniref:F-box domain-containing protein n=1 Tax=Candidatus Odyssella acanthamoebae TaxID=91604 RepID=A0A077ATZ9_9PROT|nr:hypothetical protein [Candidatus Paracaedibacter acanthamoebae]AIK96672.1 hypothetical protein ID47_07985 [Candidatus Paracaedibacter acanthamoebae]
MANLKFYQWVSFFILATCLNTFASEKEESDSLLLLNLPTEVVKLIAEHLENPETVINFCCACQSFKPIGLEEIDRRFKKNSSVAKIFTSKNMTTLSSYLTHAKDLSCTVNVSLDGITTPLWKDLGDLTQWIFGLEIRNSQIFPPPPPSQSPGSSADVLVQLMSGGAASSARNLIETHGIFKYLEELERVFFNNKSPLPNLTRLSIINCNMGGGVFLDLEPTLDFKKVSHLNISYNPLEFTQGFASFIRDKLVDYIRSGLISLNISSIKHPEHLIYALESTKSKEFALETLIMDKTDHSSQELRVLFESLKYPHLSRLSMRNCNITVKMIPSALKRVGLPALRHLDLSFNPLDKEGIMKLLSLAPCQHLESLDLSGCPGLMDDLLEEYPFIITNSHMPEQFSEMNL